MAFTSSNLHLRAGAVGDLTYTYDAGDDTIATVMASGYFLDSNGANAVNLQAEDLIWAQCSDGNVWLRVSAASTTAVVTQYAGGHLPVRTADTGTADAISKMSVGYMEVGTSIDTATRYVLPTPYPGAEVIVRKVDSGTESFAFDAGASASDVSLGASGGAAGGGTGVTFDAVGNRRITLRQEMEGFHAVASGTSRWRLYHLNITSTGKDGSYAGEGASNWIGGT